MWGTLRGGASRNRTTRPARIPSPLTPPSSEPSKRACMPRQTPRKGRSAAIQSLTVASSLDERMAPTQSRRAPTPGRTRPPAPLRSVSSGERATTGVAPTASRSFVTLRRLQMPLSMTATRALIAGGLQAALGARQETRWARLYPGRGVHRPAQALEDRLRNVVGLLPVDQLDVEVCPQRVAERAAEFLHEDEVEIPDEHGLRLHAVGEERAPAHVHHDTRQRFVHREEEESVPGDAQLVPQRLLEGLAKDKADILDRVVVVDVDVALRLDREVKEAVLREQRQHVVEEADPRRDLGHTGAVDGERYRNVRLGRLPGDSRYSLGGSFSHASRVFSRTSISSSVPTLIRRNEAVKASLGKWRTNTLRENRKSRAALATEGPVRPRPSLGSVHMKLASEGNVNQPPFLAQLFIYKSLVLLILRIIRSWWPGSSRAARAAACERRLTL